MYLRASSNNCASTVLDSFLGAVQQYGLPSRVRCDRGGENAGVSEFMVKNRYTNPQLCGTKPGSMLLCAEYSLGVLSRLHCRHSVDCEQSLRPGNCCVHVVHFDTFKKDMCWWNLKTLAWTVLMKG